jgi:hypothetical protein
MQGRRTVGVRGICRGARAKQRSHGSGIALFRGQKQLLTQRVSGRDKNDREADARKDRQQFRRTELQLG